jgi:hypothetical protein
MPFIFHFPRRNRKLIRTKPTELTTTELGGRIGGNRQEWYLMTPENEAKRLARAIRTIPVDAIVADLMAWEESADGRWCIVAGEMEFVFCESATLIWDADPIVSAQIQRWLMTQPERVHPKRESAVSFVRSQLKK